MTPRPNFRLPDVEERGSGNLDTHPNPSVTQPAARRRVAWSSASAGGERLPAGALPLSSRLVLSTPAGLPPLQLRVFLCMVHRGLTATSRDAPHTTPFSLLHRPHAPRYLFVMADPKAEAYLTANDWALFREMLAGCGTHDRGVQDAYIARLSRPGVCKLSGCIAHERGAT